MGDEQSFPICAVQGCGRELQYPQFRNAAGAYICQPHALWHAGRRCTVCGKPLRYHLAAHALSDGRVACLPCWMSRGYDELAAKRKPPDV